MEARVKLLGHPVHQMLIALPLGLLSGAVIFDVLWLIFHDAQLAAVSYWLIPAGIVTGLLAAGFGLLDWTKIPGGTRAKRIGATHGLGNAVVVLLFASSWYLRWTEFYDDPSKLALALSFAGFVLAGVTGWLGGELVDRLGVGVDDGANLNAPSSLSSRRAAPRMTEAAGHD
jgi:uncharacterized membrane protein